MAVDLEALFGTAPSTEGSGLPGISHSKELTRILALPLRDPAPLGERLAPLVTERLKTPAGTMTLRPLQALALVEAYEFRGLLGLLPVGEGKTLLSYLLPLVLPVKRPLLIVPAGHMEKDGKPGKTEIEFAELREHWQLAPMKITSYEKISRRPDWLDELAPDCLICDEVHALKDPRSACTKRVYRYIRARAKDNLRTTFCGMSGTIAARSFKDWWHIQQWALIPELQPLPYNHPTMLSWCEALDEKIKEPRPTGALSAFSDGDRNPAHVRQAFGERLRMIPSIISSKGGEVAASIDVQVKLHNVPAITDALVELRRSWSTPGGEEFSEASDLWRHAREIANGFYYKWREPGPPEWMDARREFNGFVRQTLHGSRTYDSMAQVKEAFADRPEVARWASVEHTFEPVTVPVWFCDDVIDYVPDWAHHMVGGLVWVEHRAVGERLEQLCDLQYFGEGGRSRRGNSIINHRGPAVVSQAAVSRGFNLQRYSHNLILNMTPIGTRAEQLFGRTHRQGQLEDVVHFEFLITGAEQLEGFRQMQRDSLYEQQTSGQRQKLCLADVTTTGALGA